MSMEPLETLMAYPSNSSSLIASVNIGTSEISLKKRQKFLVETVIIVDRSGSMGNYFNKIITEVLPEFFKLLSYDPNEEVHLIMFESGVQEVTCQAKDFETLKFESGGGTYLAPAVEKLHQHLRQTEQGNYVRVLTISDGEVFDSEEVKRAATEVYRYASNIETQINSQAVRLFTSSSQPDTTALCSLLQINNVIPSTLIDVPASTDSKEIAAQMAKMFINDVSYKTSQITTNSQIFYKNPWDANATDNLWLHSGQNIFWIKKLPTVSDNIRIDGEPMKVELHDQLTLGNFHALIDKKLNFIINHLKVLKIVGTVEAMETIKRMVDYFDQQESFLQTASTSQEETELDKRLTKIITKANRKISMTLGELANDDNISKLNSAQKADYLRQIDLSKSSRKLAKRAKKEGFNFDEIARSEIVEISKHINKLKDVDDSSHQRSFVSLETTLGGIRFLASLTKKDAFDGFSVIEILELFNFVGIACDGPIGDYTDPMTWKITKIHPYTFVSLSDLLVGKSLKVPGTDNEISNVIPLFEDQRIGKFLKKHAPSLLEYSCSVGMRRMIAEVPMTIGYTLSNGIWKMIEELDKRKTLAAIETFQKLLETYQMSVGKYFDHVSQLLRVQSNGKLSFFTGFNTIPNLIMSLIQIYQKKEQEKLKLLPNILRSFYSHEVWLGVRKLYKNQENWQEIARDILHEVLGIDLQKFQVKIKPMFEEEPEFETIKFHDEPNINYEKVQKIFEPLFYLKYLQLMPKFVKAAVEEDSADKIKNMPETSDDDTQKALEVDYEHKKFLFFSVFQSLRFPTRADRGDVETETMKIVDLKYEDEAMEEVKNYIRSVFEAKYSAKLAVKRKLETENQGQLAAKLILEAKTYDEMVNVWKNGTVRNGATSIISAESSSGFKTLITGICDQNKIVPQRKEIFTILLLGVDKNENPVWNNGGISFVFRNKPVQKAFLHCGTQDEWENLMEIVSSRKRHIYRANKLNRHGHGNERPSYWAMGYKTLDDFRTAVSQEDFLKFCEEHKSCCNVFQTKEK